MGFLQQAGDWFWCPGGLSISVGMESQLTKQFFQEWYFWKLAKVLPSGTLVNLCYIPTGGHLPRAPWALCPVHVPVAPMAGGDVQ